MIQHEKKIKLPLFIFNQAATKKEQNEKEKGN